jgi:hypothetical protein
MRLAHGKVQSGKQRWSRGVAQHTRVREEVVMSWKSKAGCRRGALHASVPLDGRQVLRCADVQCVLVGVVAWELCQLCNPLVSGRVEQHTWVLVVADSEELGHVGTDVGESSECAVLSGTADVGGVSPDDLGEVAPLLKVGHVWLSLAIETIEVVNLAVVKEIGDDRSDVVALNTCGDVLAVTATVRGTEEHVSSYTSRKEERKRTRRGRRHSWKQ